MARTKSEKAKLKKEYDRKRREQMKNDPVKLQEMKKNEQMKYLKKKQKKQVKNVKDMSDREHRQKQKQWRTNSNAYRERLKSKQKLNEFISMQSLPTSSQDPNTSALTINLVSASKRNAGRKRLRRDRTKLYKENMSLKEQIKSKQRLAEKWKKRYQNLSKKNNGTPPKNLTPRSKVKKLLGKEVVSPQIRKKLLFGEVISAELESTFKKKGKSQNGTIKLYNILTGKIIKKYRMLRMASPFIRYKSLIRKMKNDDSRDEEQLVKSRGKFVPRKVKEAVVRFYESDDNSRILPGKDDCITRKKIKKQKRLLSESMKVLHEKFLKETNYQYNLSYPSFCRIKPFWVLKPKVENRNTVACKIHANMNFLVSKLHECNIIDFKNTHQLIESLCCNRYEVQCLLRQCNICKNRCVKYTMPDKETLIRLKRWTTKTVDTVIKGKVKKTKKPIIEEIVKNKQELAKELECALPKFMNHVANITHQYKQMKILKENLPHDSVVIHVDFSENYQTKYGEEIQTVHFGSGRTQLTLHCGVMYLRRNTEDTNVSAVPFCSISESLAHGSSAIWAHLQPVFKYAMELNPNLKCVHMLSDGPVTQYKNKFMFNTISKYIHKILPNVTLFTWNYSESSHGKGAPDGVGGFIKRTADTAVAYGTNVQDFKTFFSVIKEKCGAIEIFHVTPEEIESSKKKFGADSNYEAFKGTQMVHQVVFRKDKPKLTFRSLSCFDCKQQDCSHYYLGEGYQRFGNKASTSIDAQTSHVLNEIKKGDWVLLLYEDEEYPGEVIAQTNDTFKISAMHFSKTPGTYKWPAPKLDIHIYHVSDIIKKIVPPVPYDRRATLFTFPCLH